MASPFAGISMMSYALRNFQTALETSGHNVSNVNTQGYSRQRVTFSPNEPYMFYSQGWQSLGQGMHVSQISRIRDQYLDRSFAQSQGSLGKFSAASSGLSSIEQVYNEPSDSGIVSALGQFFDAWSGLGSNPSDQGAKFQVRNAGQVLADRVRGSFQDLDQQQTDVTGRINAEFARINDLGSTIDKLNKAIRGSAVSGQNANDLLDQRDQAVQQLSSIVNVQTETFDDGTLAVYAAGFTLVDSAGTLPIPTTYDAVAGTLTDGTTTNPVRSGELAGLFVQHAELTNQKTRLDGFANNLRTTINAIHTTGVNGAGTTNINFFNDVPVPPQTGAIDFDLDLQIKADVNNVMSGVSGDAGDGGLALSLAAARDQTVVGLGTKTFNSFMHDTIDSLASATAYYKQAADTEQAVNQQIQGQIQSVSGVSIDDEMADMVKFQRSYQAAAKTLTIYDQMAQDIINMLSR